MSGQYAEKRRKVRKVTLVKMKAVSSEHALLMKLRVDCPDAGSRQEYGVSAQHSFPILTTAFTMLALSATLLSMAF